MIWVAYEAEFSQGLEPQFDVWIRRFSSCEILYTVSKKTVFATRDWILQGFFFSVSKTWKPVQKYSLLGPDPDIMREIPLVWGDANLGHRWPSMALTFIVKRGMIKGYVPHIFCIIFFLCCLVVTFKGNTWKCTTHGGNENRADLHHLLFYFICCSTSSWWIF